MHADIKASRGSQATPGHLIPSATGVDFCFWHKADIRCAANFVRFRTTTDKGGFWPGMVCPLLTVVSTDRRNTLSYREKMECDDGSEISSWFYRSREDGVMGLLATG